MPTYRKEVTQRKISYEPPTPKEAGSLIVWHWFILADIPESKYYSVSCTDEAKSLINELSEEDLNNPDVTDNAFGLEISVPVTNTWTHETNFAYEEWENENGEDVMEVIANEYELQNVP